MTITSQTGTSPTVQAPSGSSSEKNVHLRRGLLVGLLTLAPIGVALAVKPPQTPPPPPPPRAVVAQPSANARFQQTVQQNQATQQLQQAQVEQQLHQGVSNNSRSTNANNPQLQQQQDQAAAAQQQIDRARQQDIMNRSQTTPLPAGRVIVPQNPPSKAATPKPTGGG